MTKRTKIILSVVAGLLALGLIGSAISPQEAELPEPTASAPTPAALAETSAPEPTPSAEVVEPDPPSPDPDPELSQPVTSAPGPEVFAKAKAAYEAWRVKDDQAKASLDFARARPLKLEILAELSEIIGCPVNDAWFGALEYTFENNAQQEFNDNVELFICAG